MDSTAGVAIGSGSVASSTLIAVGLDGLGSPGVAAGGTESVVWSLFVLIVVV